MDLGAKVAAFRELFYPASLDALQSIPALTPIQASLVTTLSFFAAELVPAVPAAPEHVDRLLTLYLEHLVRIKSPPSHSKLLLTAVRRSHSFLPSTSTTRRSIVKSNPVRHFCPIPERMTFALVNQTLLMGNTASAVAFALAYTVFLRAEEAERIRFGDVLFSDNPRVQATLGLDDLTIWVEIGGSIRPGTKRAREAGEGEEKGTKTAPLKAQSAQGQPGVFMPLIRSFFAGKPPSDYAFPKADSLRRHLKEAAEALRFPVTDRFPCMHGMRHGHGADAATAGESRGAIANRGRWGSSSSVDLYTRDAELIEVSKQFPVGVLETVKEWWSRKDSTLAASMRRQGCIVPPSASGPPSHAALPSRPS